MIVLAVHNDGERRLRVIELLDDRSRAYLEGDALYTHIDRDGENLLGYVETMRAALAGSARVLLLGTAGGALATALSRRGAEVTAVDDMAWAFTAARRWFHLPNQIECVHADALAFLRSGERQWTGIAIDVFRGMEIPDQFLTSDFGDLLVGALESGGVVVWNVADDPLSGTVARVVRSMRGAGLITEAIQVSTDEYSNTVVVCRPSEHDQNTARDSRGEA